MKAKDILLGIAVGDALGVPYEFSSREQMERKPADDMIGYKVHNQPSGTWSDDSSLSFCLAEDLISGYTLKSTASKFIQWKNDAYWTAHFEVFDIGMTTNRAISRLEKILISKNYEELKFLKYDSNESNNGNGSLMRILPFLFQIRNKPIGEQFAMVWENSALTHAHIRAAMSCMIYLKFAELLSMGNEKFNAYALMQKEIKGLWLNMDFDSNEQLHFQRVITHNIFDLPKEEIKSGGYVLESLEASIWSFLTTESYEDSVLTAVNLGNDTDTTGAITGGLAGLYYGHLNIPHFWIQSLARLDKILELGERLDHKYTRIRVELLN